MADHTDPIEHVVMLMLENRSFDQMLGDFQRLYPNLDGIDPASPPRGEVVDGRRYEQRPTTVRRASNDPNHELASVLRQIGAPPGHREELQGRASAAVRPWAAAAST
jgi:phospholipase C